MKILFLLFSALKLGKVFTTAGTMLLSVAVYAFIFGWPYAVGFVLLILVHEMGHYIAARRRGLDVGAPTFIPFVGAWIEMKSLPHDVETEAYVGLAGPFAGTLGALACYYLGLAYDSKLLLALSYAGFFINLFNLVPVSPFDGGRVTAVLSPRIWLLGAPILVGLFFYNPSPILILMVIISLPQVMKAWRYDANAPENRAYYGVSTQTKLTYGGYYLGLLGYLAVMAHDTHAMLQTLRVGG